MWPIWLVYRGTASSIFPSNRGNRPRLSPRERQECDRTPATKWNHFFPLGSMFFYMYPVIHHPDSLPLRSGTCPYDLDSALFVFWPVSHCIFLLYNVSCHVGWANLCQWRGYTYLVNIHSLNLYPLAWWCSVGGLFSHCIFSSMKVLYLVNMQEDILVIHCSPQSVFRVRPATCCSSTLSSEPALPLVSSLRCTYISQPGHASSILCAAFSPMGKLLATASDDNNVWLWDLDMETALCEWRRGVGHAIIFSTMYQCSGHRHAAVTLWAIFSCSSPNTKLIVCLTTCGLFHLSHISLNCLSCLSTK